MSTTTIPKSSAPAGQSCSQPPRARRSGLQLVLLGCGVLSSVLYISAEVYAWSQVPGYSPNTHAFSELRAEGAPTRPLMVAVAGAPYNLLVAALGVGVWASSSRRAARATGGLLLVYALVSYLGGTVFQMDPRGTEGSMRTLLHEWATAVMVVSMLVTMGVGAFLHGVRFRVYSIATLVTVIAFAALSFQQASLLAAHQPAPWLGLIERVSIYAWMVWVAALAMSLCVVAGSHARGMRTLGAHALSPRAAGARDTRWSRTDRPSARY